MTTYPTCTIQFYRTPEYGLIRYSPDWEHPRQMQIVIHADDRRKSEVFRVLYASRNALMKRLTRSTKEGIVGLIKSATRKNRIRSLLFRKISLEGNLPCLNA